MCLYISDFINMFLMKYEEPSSPDAYSCEKIALNGTITCNSQTLFYPNQVNN